MTSSFVRIADWHDDMVAIMRIREAVFINEQHVPPEQEWDDLDSNATHFLAIDGNYPMGTARLTMEDEDCARVSRVSVLKDWRGLQVGDQLLTAVIEEAKKLHVKCIILTAQKHAFSFYARFGFEQISDEFLEVGIPHIDMSLTLA